MSGRQDRPGQPVSVAREQALRCLGDVELRGLEGRGDALQRHRGRVPVAGVRGHAGVAVAVDGGVQEEEDEEASGDGRKLGSARDQVGPAKHEAEVADHGGCLHIFEEGIVQVCQAMPP